MIDDKCKVIKFRKLGDVTAKYESGKSGAKTISSGKGDPGGVSYGSYQLASKTGTLEAFLKASAYSKDFTGLTPGTSSFNQKWLEMCDKAAFITAQHDFIAKTHYNPVLAYCKSQSLPYLDNDAVMEAIWSMSVQHSYLGCKKIINAAQDVLRADYNCKDLLKALYQSRTNYVSRLEMGYLKKRYDAELHDLLILEKIGI